MKKNSKQGKKPFFARLLETQELEHVVGGACLGADNTNKYPSDRDEAARTGSLPSVVDNTSKYPSDRDEAV